MQNIRKDLIEKELNYCYNTYHVKNFKYRKLSNKFIDWLFNKYYCHEMCENFYDSEPEYDDDEFDRYMSYNSLLENDYYKYHKGDYTKEELRQSYNNIIKKRKDYESKRIEFCNWQEPYFKGNWDMSQKYVNNIAKYTLKKEIRNVPNIKDRLFVSIDKDKIRIYWYGRDIKEKDYWFIFLRKEKC